MSWAAIFAGAAAAAITSILMLILGVGLGFTAVSPWAYEGASAEAFGWGTIIWISLTAIVASAWGGYLAGRLRIRWVAIHAGETRFRDIAHGFLAWAVATLLTAAFLTSAVSGIIGAGLQAGASAASGLGATATRLGSQMVGAEDADNAVDYFVDQLLRNVEQGPQRPAQQPAAPMADGDDPMPMRQAPAPAPAPDADDAAENFRGEAARIFAQGLRGDALDEQDANYLAQAIARRTTLSEDEARSRVDESYQRLQARIDEMETQAREMADGAREAAAYASLWMFLSLLLGAISASVAATMGGRSRDL